MLKMRGLIIAAIYIIFITFCIPCTYGQSSREELKIDSLIVIKDTTKILLDVPAISISTYENLADSIFFNSLQSDTIPLLKRDANGLIVFDRDWSILPPWITFRDTMFYDPSFLPVVFNGKILPDDLNFSTNKSIENQISYHLVSPDSTFAPMLEKAKKIREQRYNYYSQVDNMEKMKYSESILSGITPLSAEPIKKNIIQELITVDKPIELTTPEIQKYVPKRVYWKKNGEHKIEVAQNHISDNWHKGGESNYYVQSYQKIMLNYAKEKVTFNNTIEWRLGFQSTSGDTLRDIRVNTDAFRSYSVFGYKAYENWSYSSSMEVITQFFNQYKQNERKRRTALFSPLDINVGLGMSYNLNKSFKNNLTKKVKFSLNLAPLSLNFRYIMDDKVDETSFKLEKDHNTKTSWGSLINADLTYNFNSFLTWTSRFKYLTDYESVVSEFENRFDLALNRYFSTSFYLYARYDENSKKDDKLKYFQFNELLSFGLNYKW